MTWLGIVIVIYWGLNILTNIWAAGNGGIEITPGAAALAAVIQVVLIFGVLIVGTGTLF